MIVDTNIILRLIDGEALPQHKQVVELVRSAREVGEQLLVTDATFLEVAFVLGSQAAGYGWDLEATAGTLLDILESVPFTFERPDVLRETVRIYREHGFDAHDCYLAARAKDQGVRVLSLDGDFKKL